MQLFKARWRSKLSNRRRLRLANQDASFKNRVSQIVDLLHSQMRLARVQFEIGKNDPLRTSTL